MPCQFANELLMSTGQKMAPLGPPHRVGIRWHSDPHRGNLGGSTVLRIERPGALQRVGRMKGQPRITG